MAHSPTGAPCTTSHAVILAAGESKRTRPLTSYRPKPLIPLLGQPLLAHILDELVGLVERVTLVVGYMADAIEAHFGPSYRDIALRYVRQPEVNGTAGALLTAEPIGEPFFLLYGDNLIARADLLGVCDEPYKLAGLRVEDARAFGVLQLEHGAVRGILEKPALPPPDALANPGIFHFAPDVMPLVRTIRPSPRGELELTDLIELLAGERRVGHHVCAGHWVPVGTPWEALSASQFLLARRAALRASIDPTAELAQKVTIEGAVTIGAGARLETGARVVGPARIGAGCVVGERALVERTALEDGALIGPAAIVRDSALGAGASVETGALVESSWLDDNSSLGPGATLRARRFDDLRPAAETNGLLSRTMLCTRGAVLGRGVRLGAGEAAEAGSVLAR